ncbi:hypothetical protein BCR44DRAFT_329388 [Catenaria anguillulae PL171]|uniref:Uncharacterized protein n=1 Tax=Catenaria anguillulae PL171 TaxID=765915 RepID=A0A1Y2HAI8_9FUNG|nr:hypothetical protein BCR44DRAFT_329388 [Catenaria anguillulae PL171]
MCSDSGGCRDVPCEECLMWFWATSILVVWLHDSTLFCWKTRLIYLETSHFIFDFTLQNGTRRWQVVGCFHLCSVRQRPPTATPHSLWPQRWAAPRILVRPNSYGCHRTNQRVNLPHHKVGEESQCINYVSEGCSK